MAQPADPQNCGRQHNLSFMSLRFGVACDTAVDDRKLYSHRKP